jgi:hypothetical protein
MTNPFQEPSAEELEAALKKTGFLLEHRVAKLLRNYDPAPEVTMSAAYPDAETGKSRELDVYANLYDFIPAKSPTSIQASVALLIECKNNSGPFVMIGDRASSSAPPRSHLVTAFDPFSMRFPGAKTHNFIWETDLWRMPGLEAPNSFVGRQLLRMTYSNKAWKADNNSVYDSIMYPLAKAWKHWLEGIEKADDEDMDDWWQYPLIQFIQPVVVTSSSLYTVDATEENLVIDSPKWGCITRTFESKDLTGHFYADVVPFTHLKDYLDEKVMVIYRFLQETARENARFYDPEWMASNFGQPRNSELFQDWLDFFQSHRSSDK